MVLRLSWFGVFDMVSSFYFTGKDIVVDISDALYTFLSEKYGWTAGFMAYFLHFRYNLSANIVILAF